MTRKNILFLFSYIVLILTVFLGVLVLGNDIGLQQSAVATICSATALAISAIIAFLAFQLNRQNSQEPWVVTFRELHKEFWNDEDYAKVRAWLCCDEAYKKELEPVLAKRLSGQVSIEEYLVIEKLDKFFALMLRVVYMHSEGMNLEQQTLFKSLNYYWWLHKVKTRIEIKDYAELTTENLYPFIENAKFHQS